MIQQLSNMNFKGNVIGTDNVNKVEYNTSPQIKDIPNDSFSKQNTPRKKEIGIIAGIAVGAMAIGLGAIAIIKFHNKAKALKDVPEELRAIFQELKNESGENFINKAYAKIKKHMNLDGIAPEKVAHNGADKGFSVQGGYIPCANTIGYTDGFFTKLKKHQQINFISHELKHVEQTSKILRSGLIDEYADAWGAANVNNALNDPLNFPAQMAKISATNSGKLSEFVEKAREEAKKQVLDMLKKNHEETLKLPKYEVGSPEYMDAKRYIDASKNYEGVGFFGIAGENYKNNPLEVEAYAFGDKMEKLYKDSTR